MEQSAYKLYGYRWLILVVFMLVAAFNQLIWITFAPITDAAAAYYHVSQLDIGLLSMSFMIAFLVFSIPASWVIDTYGFRIAVGIGAALTGIFGLMRGLVASNFTLVMVAQIGTAVGQPFILNALTKVAARWFPIEERATASGLGSLAMYLGILAGLALTPSLALNAGFSNMLLYYGVGALAVGIIFIVFAREHPATPPGPVDQEERALMFDGMKQILRNKNFLLLMSIFFIGLGVFNSVTTWIEDIISPRGFTATQAGTAGGLMIVGGIVGAVILPTLSDKYRKRVPFIIIGLVGTIPGLLGITYAALERRAVRGILRAWIFPVELRSHWVPIRRGDRQAGPGGDFERLATSHGTDFRNCFHLWHGRIQSRSERIHDAVASRHDGSGSA